MKRGPEKRERSLKTDDQTGDAEPIRSKKYFEL
jgi:hypothetical protein